MTQKRGLTRPVTPVAPRVPRTRGDTVRLGRLFGTTDEDDEEDDDDSRARKSFANARSAEPSRETRRRCECPRGR